MGCVKASASLLGVPLGQNSFFHGPAFSPPRIRDAIWCGHTNSSTKEDIIYIIEILSNYVECKIRLKKCGLCYVGKELNDPRVLTDVGDVHIQEIRDCGVEDERLMHVISESVKTVMRNSPYLYKSDLMNKNVVDDYMWLYLPNENRYMLRRNKDDLWSFGFPLQAKSSSEPTFICLACSVKVFSSGTIKDIAMHLIVCPRMNYYSISYACWKT